MRSYSMWDLMSTKQKLQFIFFIFFVMPPLFWSMIAVLEINFNDKHLCKEWRKNAFLCSNKGEE